MALTKQEAIDRLRQNKCKVTPQRDIILDVLLSADGYITVKDIHERISQLLPHISLDTVYRNLELLACIGVLTKANIGHNMVYEMHKNAHTHIMKCLSCGKIEELDICPLDYCINRIKTFR